MLKLTFFGGMITLHFSETRFSLDTTFRVFCGGSFDQYGFSLTTLESLPYFPGQEHTIYRSLEGEELHSYFSLVYSRKYKKWINRVRIFDYVDPFERQKEIDAELEEYRLEEEERLRQEEIARYDAELGDQQLAALGLV